MGTHQVKERFASQIRALGTRIQAIRMEKGFSQEKLANLAKISKNSVVNIENGSLNPSFATLCAIAYGLNISWDDLVGKIQISPNER